MKSTVVLLFEIYHMRVIRKLYYERREVFMPRKTTVVEWVCTACGKHSRVSKNLGRPIPGICPRALIKGRPHRWVKNREL